MEQTISTAILELHTYKPDCEVFLRTEWMSEWGYKIRGTEEYVASMVVFLLAMNPLVTSRYYIGENNELTRRLKKQIEISIIDKKW